MNVLIVDDNPTNRKLLRVTLEAEGFTTLEATDGLEALAALEQQPVEAVISDILMPRMDGFRLCHELRSHARFDQVPFIIYSATYTSPTDEKLALNAGADRYLRKPCPVATMVAAIREAAAAAQQRPGPPPTPAPKAQVMRQYNEALVRKLEEYNAELERQREWLRVTLSSIGDAVLATDAAGRITFLNPVAESLTGWAEKEALGQPFQHVFQMLNEETRVPGEDIVARVLREGGVVALANHTALVARGGREIPIEDSAAPIKDSAGTVSGVVLVFHDVTEKRLTQETLRESERQFRTLADSIPNLAWWANSDGYITWYNRRWYEYTGTTPQQMEGWGWQSVPDPQTLPAVLARWKVSLASGEPFDMTFPLRGADGVFRPFLTRVMPLKDSQGRVQQWFGTNTDVSEQKRAEETEQRLNHELRQRMAEVKAASEEVQASRRAALSLAEDSLEARQQGERVSADLQKANESLGVSRRAALNLMDDAVRARKEAEQASAELVRLNRILKAHSKSDQALMRATGEAEYLAAVCKIVVEDCGHAMVWVGFAEADEVKSVRPAAQAGFEQGYLETLKITWADTERGRGPTGTAIRTGQPSTCRNIHTDPRFAPWRDEAIKRGYASSLVLPLLADGRAIGALSIYSKQPDGFGKDEVRLLTELAGDVAYGITAIRLREAKERAEEALRQSAEDLERSNRDLEQFAYVASHDLQEPLRAVGGYVKLLQLRFPDKLDAKAQGYIAGASDGATRMERLIRDLLAFSRVATRGDPFVPADLEDALGQALRNLEASVNSSQATIAHDPLPSLSVDAGQIRQLFQNLIGNALKFHGEQPPNVHIGAQRQDGRWVFWVRDNGIGIEPQYYEKIFLIFQRLHTRKDYPGTGVGLAICKRIVERHGGTIWVESQPGQGSTFYFSLLDTPLKTALEEPG
jgi:PAS domain S-box-containing protein